nr:MAG TPA: hypothetical protein [Caudoviricetes sp.]
MGKMSNFKKLINKNIRGLFCIIFLFLIFLCTIK